MAGDFRSVSDLRASVTQLEPDEVFIARLSALARSSGAAGAPIARHQNWKAGLATVGVAGVITASVALAAALPRDQEPVPLSPPATEPVGERESQAPDPTGDRVVLPPIVIEKDRRTDAESEGRRAPASSPQESSGAAVGEPASEEQDGPGLDADPPESEDDGPDTDEADEARPDQDESDDDGPDQDEADEDEADDTDPDDGPSRSDPGRDD